MQSVTINKDKLLSILRENKSAHDEAYKAALEGYWEKVEQELEIRLNGARAQAGIPFEDRNPVDNNLRLVYPESHADDFERVIRMLELEIALNVELNAPEFDQYVRNQWAWAQAFVSSTMAYAGEKARTHLMKFSSR